MFRDIKKNMFLGNSDIFTLFSPSDCYYHQTDTNTENISVNLKSDTL